MAKSMTGYGQGQGSSAGKAITVELKSVNHRFLDISVRLPRQYSILEERFRRQVKEKVARGRIDIYVKMEDELEAEKEIIVDKALAEAYLKSLRELADALEIDGTVSAYELSRLDDVLRLNEEEDLDAIWVGMEEALTQALDQLIEMRHLEGEKLKADVMRRKHTIERLTGEIAGRTSLVVAQYQKKLTERVKELLGDTPVDEERIAQEVAIMAEKSDISEELVRLKSHLEQLEETLLLDQPIGRKLDFIVQEMHREINTIGSKNIDVTIGRLVVEIKSEIEKIREQVQNIE
ncbi:MAG: YicC family protein [Thermoanaerobacteraceae bacterium]|nr:YicC family protein [Thermoanaerobacteraceae bacterium]